MQKSFQVVRGLLVGLLSFQMVSCGTILYPERRGQKAGHLDAGVVLLDAIGLLFFLIPGIIAFVVDFSNGTIYMPASSVKGDTDGKYRVVHFDPHNYTISSLEETISHESGREFHFTDKELRQLKLESADEIPLNFSRYKNGEEIQLSAR